MGRILSWFNKCWSWTKLSLTDKLKLIAIFVQTGAGVAMTAFAAVALWQLASQKAVWPVFYMGLTSLIIIGIVVSGFGALLYKRTVEFEVFGAKFKASDQQSAAAMAESIKSIQEGSSDVQHSNQ